MGTFNSKGFNKLWEWRKKKNMEESQSFRDLGKAAEQ